ncbi:cysteine-rich receptor-like protein kinase 25 [Quercus suber]|uniref:Nuclear pore complex protein Nup85 n=1 Tax=Quercus suber TaxID=58331 RepID=A0AAW0JYV1_QUESU
MSLLEILLSKQPIQNNQVLLKIIEICHLYELDSVSSDIMKVSITMNSASKEKTQLSLLLLATLIPISQPEPIYNYHYCSVGLGSLEQANDDYLSNLTVLLDSLSSKASQNYSFYKAISNNTGIYGLFLCQGDFSQYTCQPYVSYVSNYIKTRCPGKSAIAWYNECMLSFFGVPQTEPHVFMWNAQNNITAPEEPNFGALGLMNNLRDKVFGTEMLFKAGNMSVGNGNGFRYAWCTRDINSTQCGNCLQILIEKVQDCCQARTEFRIISPSCFLRYGNYSLFLEASAPVLPPLPSPLLPSPLPGNGNERNITQIAIIVTTVIILNLVISLCIFLKLLPITHRLHLCHHHHPLLLLPSLSFVRNFRCNQKLEDYFFRLQPNYENKSFPSMNIFVEKVLDVKSLQFDFGTIIIATNNFAEANKLGKGGFGAVYKSHFHYFEKINDKLGCRKISSLTWYMRIGMEKLDGGTATNLIDPTLKDSQITEIMRCIHTGLLCVQKQPVARPNMTSVVAMINSDSITLPVPTQPADFTQSNVVLDTPLQQDFGYHVTKYELSITELYPR